MKHRGLRRWALPPVIERGPADSVDHLGILSEHGEVDGMLLWRIVRDVDLWAKTPVDARMALFTPQAAESRTAWLRDCTFPQSVCSPLAALTRLLLTPSESPATSNEVSAACCATPNWARATGAKETAVSYAQAAALASPDAPRYAILTGQCAEELGQHARAATWFQRAVTLARRAKDWSTYSLASVGVGIQAEAEGRTDRAHRAYIRAFRAGRRWGLLAERARAAYRLFRLARSTGDNEMSSRYARIVSRAPLEGIGIPAALDVAEFWIAHRQATPARRLLADLSRKGQLPDGERFTLAVLRARAAIAAQEPIPAKRAWKEAWALEAAAPGHRTDALLQLAALAARLKDADALRRAGKAALVNADSDEYARVHAALRRIGGRNVDFGPPLAGAA